MNQLIPPHNIIAEQSVLGALLTNNALADEIIPMLKPEDFYQTLNREVYKAILSDLKKGSVVDVTTLSNHDGIDLGYSIELAKACPASENAIVYARTVKDKSIQRQLIAACYDIQQEAYNNPESIIGLLGTAEKQISNVVERLETLSKDTSVTAALKDMYDQIKYMSESDGSLVGLSTGLDDLDRRINGLKKGTMIVLAARPGMGKTTLAINMVEKIALAGGFPLVFSIEMPRFQLMQKMTASVGNVPLSAIQNPKSLSDYQWAGIDGAMRNLKKTNLEIIDEGSITTDMIRLECRRYKKRHGKISIIMVDYIQLIRGSSTENRTQEISGISRDLKSLAKEFDCPVLALSQLSRSVEQRANKRPINSDLRESGQIEQDAEEIIFIYRDEQYDDNSMNKGLAEIIVSKCRMGITGTVVSEFHGELSRFDNTNKVVTQSKQKSFSERFAG